MPDTAFTFNLHNPLLWLYLNCQDVEARRSSRLTQGHTEQMLELTSGNSSLVLTVVTQFTYLKKEGGTQWNFIAKRSCLACTRLWALSQMLQKIISKNVSFAFYHCVSSPASLSPKSFLNYRIYQAGLLRLKCDLPMKLHMLDTQDSPGNSHK